MFHRRFAGYLLLGIAWLALPVAARAAVPPVERVDPPSWWVGFGEPRVQLMIHGRGVAAMDAAVDYPGVRVADVKRLDSPNYLFVTLEIAPDTRPGPVPVSLRRKGHPVVRFDYRLEARASGSRDRRGFDSSDAIYLIVPDRFANATPANDQPPGTTDHVDRANPDARHGGDLAGVRQHLDYIEQMGFTQIWMTPTFENAQPVASYHGYSITDHYRVDPRLGTAEELRALSKEARSHGIGLIADEVVNHIGSHHWWMADLPSRDWISGDGSRAATNHAHTTVQDPHASEADRRRYIDGWFSPEMPDLHTMTPELGTYLIQQALWWIEYADLSGLRIDTYSYSDKRFMAEYTRRIMAEYPRFNIVGEEWRVDPGLVAYWQSDKVNPDGYVSHLPSLMDFPVQSAISEALVAKETTFGGLRTLYERLGLDFLYPHPDRLVVFADNHDTDRIYATVGRDDALFRLAMTFVATTRGIPQVVYGTEVLLANEHSGKDGERRGDFPGGWSGDVTDGFTGRGLDRHTQEAQAFMRRLFTWRRQSPAVQHGSLRHYTPADGVYVYFREAEGESVMVVLSKATTPVRLDLARFRESLRRGAVGREILTDTSVTLEDSLEVAPRSAMVIDIR